MSDKLKWKEALLYSGMPLEFEAARLLVSEGFTVNADFKYAWDESETRADSAIDLHGKARLPFSGSGDGVTSQMEMLVDCKHRAPKSVGLFLPDLNPSGASPAAPGRTIRVIDQFSPCVISPEAFISFETGLPICYKGIEVNMETGEADESVFKRGIRGLQAPLPRLMAENILFFMTGPEKDNIPFLFCPVLLTTVPLYVLKKEVTPGDIEGADRIQDVGVEVPYLTMYSDLSSGFKSGCAEECGRLRAVLRTDRAMSVERRKARYYNSQFNLPFTIIDALNAADYYYLNMFFTQFIVCTQKAFPDFVRGLKETTETALATRKEVI